MVSVLHARLREGFLKPPNCRGQVILIEAPADGWAKRADEVMAHQLDLARAAHGWRLSSEESRELYASATGSTAIFCVSPMSSPTAPYSILVVGELLLLPRRQ